MSELTTTGIPNPDKLGWWLVPPWEAEASLCDVVLHFLCHWPETPDSTAYHTAFYGGLLTAIDAAIPERINQGVDERWLQEFRTAIARCAATYRIRQESRSAMYIESPGLRKRPGKSR